jgi:hypothetical protein
METGGSAVRLIVGSAPAYVSSATRVAVVLGVVFLVATIIWLGSERVRTMTLKGGRRLLAALVARQESVKKLEVFSRRIGARYIAEMGLGDDSELSARDDADRHGVAIAWNERPFSELGNPIISNYVGIERPYGGLAAYVVVATVKPQSGSDDSDDSAELAGTDNSAGAALPQKLYVYDFLIPGQVKDPSLTSSPEDDADVDPAVRTPDVDADIRYLEDRAASLCIAPSVSDVTDHHLVVLDDLDRAGRQQFYRGVEEISKDAA